MNANKRKWNFARNCNGRTAPLLLAVALAVMLMGTNTRAQVGTKPPGVTQRQTTTPLPNTALRWTYCLRQTGAEASTYPSYISVVATSAYVIISERGRSVHAVRRADGAFVWSTQAVAASAIPPAPRTKPDSKDEPTSDYVLSPLHTDSVVFFVLGLDARSCAVCAVEAATGHVLWQKRADSEANGNEYEAPMLVGVYGDVTALVRGSYDKRRIELVRTATGQILDHLRPDDKRLLQKAIAEQKRSVVPVTVDGTLSLLRLDTGTFTRLDLPFEPYEGFGVEHHSYLVGQNKTQTLIVSVDDESDVTGSSVNPKYILGVDRRGGRHWQVPTHLRKSYQEVRRENFNSFTYPVQWIPDGDVLVVLGGDDKIFAVSGSDGKRLWGGLLSEIAGAGVAAYRGGMFALFSGLLSTGQDTSAHPKPLQSMPRNLAYINARTGRQQLLAQLKGNFAHSWYDFSALTVDGDDLFVADGSSVRVYSCGNLLSLPPATSPERTQRR